MNVRLHVLVTAVLLGAVSSNVVAQSTQPHYTGNFDVNIVSHDEREPLFLKEKKPYWGYASHNQSVATKSEARQLIDYINLIRVVHVPAAKKSPLFVHLESKLALKFKQAKRPNGAVDDVFRKKVGPFSVVISPNINQDKSGGSFVYIGQFYLEDGPCMPWSVFAEGMGLANQKPSSYEARDDGYQIEYKYVPSYNNNAVQVGILPDGRFVNYQTPVTGDACVGYIWQYNYAS